MEEQLFQEYPEDQREKMLSDNCDSVEQMSYSIPLSQEELSVRKDRLSVVAIKESELQDELKEIREEFKEKIKPVTREKQDLLEDIKLRSTHVSNGKAYKMVEGRKVGYYTPKGNLIFQRPANPEEMQLTIQSNLRKTGTSN